MNDIARVDSRSADRGDVRSDNSTIDKSVLLTLEALSTCDGDSEDLIAKIRDVNRYLAAVLSDMKMGAR